MTGRCREVKNKADRNTGKCIYSSSGYATNYWDLPELKLLTETLKAYAAFSRLRHLAKSPKGKYIAVTWKHTAPDWRSLNRVHLDCHFSYQRPELYRTGRGWQQWLRHSWDHFLAHGPVMPKAKLWMQLKRHGWGQVGPRTCKQRPCPVNWSGLVCTHEVT